MSAAAVDPERLLKDLRTLWRDLAKHDEAGGVLRACAMTLIVVADEARDANIINETIASMVQDHPSRAIVVRVRQCHEQVLEARVFAQCWKPAGGRQQICCEQVEITASVNALSDVATVIRGLVVPDLPSILFCPSENLWWLPQFASLLPLADKVTVDSCDMRESANSIDLLAHISASVEQKADLVWSRLTPWRQAIARIFEESSRAKQVFSLDRISVVCHDNEKTSAIYYLAGWFRHVLGPGVPVELTSGGELQYAGVTRITLSGPGLEATVAITDNNTAETRVNGQVTEVTVFPMANDEYALRQELSVAGGDALFNDVLRLAKELRETH